VIPDGSRIGPRVAKNMTKKSGRRRKLKIERVEANVIKVDFKANKMSEEEKRMAEYLEDSGYESVEGWALDSGYYYDDNEDIWLDEEDNIVDIEQKLWYTIDSMEEE
jgi:hypothetical protein